MQQQAVLRPDFQFSKRNEESAERNVIGVEIALRHYCSDT